MRADGTHWGGFDGFGCAVLLPQLPGAAIAGMPTISLAVAEPSTAPPVVYVVPPAYSRYQPPLYSVRCCGTIYGPRGSYYTAYYSRYGYRGYFAHRHHR